MMVMLLALQVSGQVLDKLKIDGITKMITIPPFIAVHPILIQVFQSICKVIGGA